MRNITLITTFAPYESSFVRENSVKKTITTEGETTANGRDRHLVFVLLPLARRRSTRTCVSHTTM